MPSSIPGEPILRPRGEKTLDWEVELGVVIGKTARFVTREQALDYVYGYTIINDASARDFQFHTSQWGPGKMGDTLAPVGPYIADRSEIPDPHVLDLKTWVNGTLMQNGNTKNFIFDLGYIIQYLTNIMTLSPGDLISTGTPAGVGFSRKPPGHAPARRRRASSRSPGSARSRTPSRTPSGVAAGDAAWRCRSFLHYALEVPDQTVGQKYYQDFGLVDATGSGDAVRLRARAPGARGGAALRGAAQAPASPLLRRPGRGFRADARRRSPRPA